MIIVGNKADLPDLQRRVSKEELQEMAAEFGGVPAMECSAKTNYNVENSFEALIDEVESAGGDSEDEDKGKNDSAQKCLVC